MFLFRLIEKLIVVYYNIFLVSLSSKSASRELSRAGLFVTFLLDSAMAYDNTPLLRPALGEYDDDSDELSSRSSCSISAL